MNRQMEEPPPQTVDAPAPVVKTRRWPYALIWVVPVLAAAGAGYYFYERAQDAGPKITVAFTDASGLKPNETPVVRLGVPIGNVTGIELAPDQRRALVHVQLQVAQASFAKEGALFWIVRPEISTGSVSGLNTLLSGPYIEAISGAGETLTEFQGLPKSPAAPGEGLALVLHAPRLEHLGAESPVYFRGVEVGLIRGVRLSQDARGIDVSAFIWKRYAPLVRTNSRFWVVKGLDVKGGLFNGVQLKVNSLRSLVAGGITFASPEAKLGEPARPGTAFALYDEPEKDWTEWSPRIDIGPDDSGDSEQTSALPQAPQGIQSAVK